MVLIGQMLLQSFFRYYLDFGVGKCCSHQVSFFFTRARAFHPTCDMSRDYSFLMMGGVNKSLIGSDFTSDELINTISMHSLFWNRYCGSVYLVYLENAFFMIFFFKI